MARDILLVFVFVLCSASLAARKAKHSLRSGGRLPINSNIIFILTDDLDSELGSPNVMTKTRKILREGGAEFVNAFVTSPMCCPSRASILTGTYAHNHNTLTNNLNCSSMSWRRGPERKSFAKYLQEANYVTGYFGKYLNEYDGSYVPVGYSHWEGLVHNSRFYNYSIRHNKYIQRHRTSYEKDYFTDLITNDTIAFIRHAKLTKPNNPFMAVISHAAPHGPETAAPQYSTAFPDARAPRYPNWNFYSADKQWILRETPPMDERKIAFVDLLHRRRLQTMLSVDDSIERIFSTLQALEIENHTYIFFSSDHGYHLGQFGLVKGKSMPFESDIRVPFYVRGPTIPKNIRMNDMVLNIDMAPTFLDIANVKAPKDMDGTSIMKLFKKGRNGRRGKSRTNNVWRDTFLVERTRGLRRIRSGGKQSNKTQNKKQNKVTVLGALCSRPKYLSPCKPGQLWECLTIDNRPRLRKCRRNVTSAVTTAPPTRPTTIAKMCVCLKPRPGTETSDDEDVGLFPSGDLEEFTKESRRSRSLVYNDRPRRRGSEFNVHRYFKEVVRATRLQRRRSKAKLLLRSSTAGPKEKAESGETLLDPNNSFEMPEEVEEKLGKLNEKIQGIRMRLETLRDRKKKLLLLSARDQFIEYPCPCDEGNATTPTLRTAETGESDGDGRKKRDTENGSERVVPSMKKRNKQTKSAKKKKAKTNPRRSKCASPGVNCFYQTNTHWKLPPLWLGGEFCFCPNAANNSYWCLRTINATHNFLYCEFITHFVEFFDLNTDPFQLYNKVHELSPAVANELRQQLGRMRDCKGEDCTHYYGKKYPPRPTSAPTATEPATRRRSLSIDFDGESRTVEKLSTTKKVPTVVNQTTTVPLPTVSSGVGKSSENSEVASANSSKIHESSFVSAATSAPSEMHTTPGRNSTVNETGKKNSERRKSQVSVENGKGNGSFSSERERRKNSKKLRKSSKRKSSGEEEKSLNEDKTDNDSVEKGTPKNTKKTRKSKKKGSNSGNVSPKETSGTSEESEEVQRNQTGFPEKTRKPDRKPSRKTEGGGSESESQRENAGTTKEKRTTRRPANRKPKKRLRNKATKGTNSSRVDESSFPETDEEPAIDSDGGLWPFAPADP